LPALPPATICQEGTAAGTVMTVQLNHTIVHAHDKVATAKFMSELFDLPEPQLMGPFAVVQVDATSLDFVDDDGKITPRHFAFLVSEAEFDAIFGKIRDRGMPYWADPFKQKHTQINHWDDGRGVYFEDPNGHLLEIITRPYGSGGKAAKHVNPLISD
jgi:catechol 2,3-dioxygenase-like lactoylglutathione lyase family enzyme